MEGIPQKFSSPEEEIAFLRNQIAERERALLEHKPEASGSELVAVGREPLREYVSFTPKSVLKPEYEITPHEMAQSVELAKISHNPVEDILLLAKERGVRNALTVLEKTSDAYTIDEVHRRLVEEIKSGVQISDLQKNVPPWHVLHMTLYEVTLPAQRGTDGHLQGEGLIQAMQQLLSGLRTIGQKQSGQHFVIEIAVADQSDDTIFYVAVPNEYNSLFEKQTLSLFPHAVLTEQVHDYNISVVGGKTLVANVKLKKHPIYPLKSSKSFANDPLAVILNAFSKIERIGGGAAIQFVVHQPAAEQRGQYQRIIKAIEKGTPVKEAIARSTMTGEVMATIGEMFVALRQSDKKEEKPPEIDHEALELFRNKIKTDLYEVNARLVVSALTLERAEQIMMELQASFNQFDSVEGNQLTFQRYKDSALKHEQKAFSFRQYDKKQALILSAEELSTLIHFPGEGVTAAPQFKQSYAKTAAAPTELPQAGTLLGVNQHRNVAKDIYITADDRLRHFYIIGQTGTGKTTLMKNMIVQDILRGDGVCLIDPHGTDIDDVLGAIPQERAGDVIYFDPAKTDRVLGLNMLEYDPTRPEQKTFVVNELFSIFQKLYGGNPESMGPMFEQYFRNATMLVMEDPDSGNTLMDISRVMSDARYRREKLSKATNPVVVQFWTEIATKAGGEAALENIVPYIVSKFDIFTANDYMRPIIGQQHSAFNFRQIMDERKILLVNLSKGRLGEINSNLIGMIIVGKLFMAALSRVDDPTRSFAPFYLHMDEFQNVSTVSIAAILSEARKYKLGLTMAHQFIAQLQPAIRDAVFGNVGSIAAFRVGPDDSNLLAHQFAPAFTAADLMNVPNRNAFLRILANGTPTPPFSLATLAPPAADQAWAVRLKEQSYTRYGRDRLEIEDEIRLRYQKPIPPIPPKPLV